ncbi:doubled CXXCH domain protein [Solidesulfovibrio fructosivorans JJ]]|uniref:Doubled CXXCH domain protein n=1 Tax=Solidesulfovibrio fructosivorans JJ] TaxID=596151 RepID=E1JSQ8_SOLFR|nr:tetratricopeptide repeat protein [Solidesulfovibrio fructosivorans]EFL52541.1 doubled CXXCH domain protein [Solidesulfovibrio fructosivorans JJ]]
MTQATDNTKPWERAALFAAGIILASPVLYLLVFGPGKPPPKDTPAAFVGSAKCQKCHETQYKKWLGSDHRLAMAEAGEGTVLGDFGNVSFTDPYSHVVSRFFRKDGRYYVETEGPDGKPGQFRIAYTFGARPLQQYLVPFPGGRLQCLNIAWDVDKKTWYRLPPYDAVPPGDWLHWTGGGQTWNAMCAECHSTNVTKGYDPETGDYHTTWSEITVGCEACHGPGSKHLAWAAMPPLARSRTDNSGLTVRTGNVTADAQIRLCAPCHSRRFQLGDNRHVQGELLDLMVPELLNEGVYYPDGQILGEDYVYGSFAQSKMHQRGIRCSDCHDVHSGKLHKEGNAVCTQCHRAAVYDTKEHHFHKEVHEGKPSDGHLCVKCHMPGRYYMGIDYRPDHSLRVPRPDLSASIDTPNACMAKGCHADKSLAWNIEACTKWYGETRKPQYGTVFAAGRARKPEAEAGLIRLAEDPLLPAIVRATALGLLRAYPNPASHACLAKGLDDPDALIRYTAIRSLEYFDPDTRLRRIAPKLYDPVKAVRMEAAMMLSALPEDRLRPDDREAFRKALGDYRQAMRYNADLAPERYNLGNLAANRHDVPTAIREYEKAIAIDSQFYPAKVNLAVLLNGQGKNEEAERLLKEVLLQRPELYEVSYSLGLLLAEMRKYKEAEHYLESAAMGMDYGRASYNLGQVLLVLGEPERAARAFSRALELAPGDQQAFAALAGLYLRTGRTDKARELAERLLHEFPNHQGAKQLLRRLGN